MGELSILTFLLNWIMAYLFDGLTERQWLLEKTSCRYDDIDKRAAA